MKHPLLNSTDDAELEALQTDVMRFVAILGLCLAAIFSLVQRASLEQVPPLITPAPTVQAATTTASAVRQVPSSPAKPAPTAAAAEVAAISTPKPTPTLPPTTSPTIGFSLEFESAAALMALLQSEKLQLYAAVDGKFWSADGRGRFALIAAPQSYYGMDPNTVPAALVASLQRTSAGVEAAWGVALAPVILEQMQELMRNNDAGSIVISGTGRVQIEP